MKRIILVDGNSLMYKAYYATAYTGNLMKNSKGQFTNAIFSFVNMIESLIAQEYDYFLVAFDKGKKTFRHDIYENYKGGRSPMPDELRTQIPLIKEFLNIVNVKQYELELYEADDIIGTLAFEATKEGYHVDIYSSDKDLLQLVNENTCVHLSKKGLTDTLDVTPDNFKEIYGINYNQFIDYKAIVGDPSDNLPGIAGVGEKTAVKLLNEYETLQNIIASADGIKGKLGEKIMEAKEIALTCQKMCKIVLNAPVEIKLEDCNKKSYDEKQYLDFLNAMEFHSIIKRKSNKNVAQEVTFDFEVISDVSALKRVLINNSAMIFETLDENYHTSDLISIAIKNKLGNFIITPNLLNESIDLRLFLEDDLLSKQIYNYKKAYVLCLKYGIKLEGIVFDMLLASYILNPSIAKEEMKIVASYFDYSNIDYDDNIYGRGAKKMLPDSNIVYAHMIKKVTCLYLLKNHITNELKNNQQFDLFLNVEMPLSKVLAKMEYSGIKIDLEELKRQNEHVKNQLNHLEKEIHTLASKEFNISSPKQLGEVLFEELKLEVIRKGKTGYSTDADVLEKLKDSHEIIPKIMEYRTLSKLYSTYLEGMKQHIYADQKLHTIYQQTLTQTGRLSSIEPNLQNIPIRYEQGKNIRKIFITSNDDMEFLAADYSQIELRVLASMANVKLLIEAFNANHDIHAETAKKIFNKEEITYDDRRKAKAVNFGIIYGMSAWGLSEDLHISAKEADEFIRSYYTIYPEIKEFMDKVVEDAKVNGYVTTIMNRKRYIPELKSPVYNVREFGKRTAMNAPIQGSAADIIKIAMIKLDENLTKEKLKSRLILQVHDELILEVYKNEKERVTSILKEAMEKAVTLLVPLNIEYDFGTTWFDVK